MPRVSVVLCSYNQGRYIAEAVESVLRQTYADWELIVIDNGSTDDTRDVLARFDDPRIRPFLEPENTAISKRFNQGVAAARGEFVSFLYSDDMYFPDKLRLQVEAFDKLPAKVGVVHGRGVLFDDATGARTPYTAFPHSGDVLIPMLDGIGVSQLDMISPLTRRECWVRYPFYEDIFAEGECSYTKVAMTWQFHAIDADVSLMRQHGGNRGRALRKNLDMTVVCLERLGQHPDFPVSARPALDAVGPRLWARLAWWLARHDSEGHEVRECVRNAVEGSRRSLLDARMLGGLALSYVPLSARRRLNDLGFRLRNRRAPPLVAGYGGASERSA